MPDRLDIRRARASDLPQLAGLARHLAAHVGDADPGLDTQALLECGFGADPWFECLVALADERVVGFALYGRRFEAHTRSRGLFLADLCIEPECRGSGLGRRLLEAVQARAAELACTVIHFELARGNRSAQAFYARLGATPQEAVIPMVLAVR